MSVTAYRRTTRTVPRRFKRGLVGLRLLAVALLLLCLLRPSLQVTHYETIKRPLVLLIDVSRSMTDISDTPSGVSRLQAVEQALEDNAERLAELGERYDVMKLEFARSLLGAAGARGESAVQSTAYGLSLEEAFNQAANAQCDAVVMVGDGTHNAGPPDPVDVASSLNEQGVPVYTLGVGQDEATSELRDVKVLEITAPRVAPVFTRFPVRAQVRFRGCRGLSVTLALDMAGQEPIEKTVTVGHSDETVPVEFQVEPDRVGEYKVTVMARDVPNELLDTNNSASTFVKVVSDGVRVGFFDVLRPESKFIVRALEKAPQVMVRRQLTLSGRQLSEPETSPELYDVIVLGDLTYSALLPSRVAEIKRAVQDEGKGLLVLVTPISGGPRGWGSTALGELLPVRLGAGVGVAEGDREFRVAPEYADHPVVAMSPEAQDTLATWAGMPPLAGCVTGAQPKRGAVVLARDQDGHPLLAIQRAGKGRTACLMADTTFRWAFTELDTQDVHRRFWRQLLTWVSGQQDEPGGRLRLTLSRQELMLDEKLRINVSLTDRDGLAIRDAQLKIEVTDPAGEAAALPFMFSRQAASYVAEYAPENAGDYRVTASATRNGESLGTDASHFHAGQTDLELEDPIANLKLLRRMSAATQEAGGLYYYLPRAGDLFGRLKERANPLQLTTVRRRDIWDTWVLFTLFTVCMGLEWGLRKRKGLV